MSFNVLIYTVQDCHHLHHLFPAYTEQLPSLVAPCVTSVMTERVSLPEDLWHH